MTGNLFGYPLTHAERRVEADAAADSAIARITINPDWRAVAESAIEHVCRMHAELTTDDVWDRLDCLGIAGPAEPRAMGAIMRAAAERGEIAKTDRTVKSRRRENHGRDVRVWRTL